MTLEYDEAKIYGRGIEIPNNMHWLAGMHEDGYVAEIDNDSARHDAEWSIAVGYMFSEFQMFLTGPLDMDMGEGRLRDPEIQKWVLDALAKIRSGGYEQALRDVQKLAEITGGAEAMK